MARWIRFEHRAEVGFGTLENDAVVLHRGDMFDRPEPTGERIPLSSVRVLAPVRPGKMIALWNNFRELGAKLGVPAPAEPLYFIKASSSLLDPDGTAYRPGPYDGRIVYEAELAIVIGRRCASASPAEAASCIFGYTGVNDITASDILNKDPTFPQWTRAKSFDGFGPLGPAIATGLDPATLRIRLTLNGDERQNYSVSDMVFPAAELVRHISRDVTLLPGDVICCGTSVGVGTMKEPTNEVAVTIDGIGTLRTTFVNTPRPA